MAYTYRLNLDRPLTNAELDGNFQYMDEQVSQAEQAAAAAAIGGKVFENTTSGLANTIDGEYFSIPSGVTDGFLDSYKNDNGSAVFYKTYVIPDTSNFVIKDGSDNISINTAELNIPQGNPSVVSVLTDNGDGKIRKSTKVEFLDQVTNSEYLKKIYTETYSVSSGESLDIQDGTIQELTLTSNVTLSLNIGSGQSLTLMLFQGDSYTVTWPTVTWVGGIPPVLTSGDILVFFKVGMTLYASYVGEI